MANGTRMLQRRATAAVWTTSDYILASGEMGVTTDTGIIKVGNGTSPWSELPIAFEDLYLPLLGTATNSELLGGLSEDNFIKSFEAVTTVTNDSVAKRTSTGTLKAATAVASDDLATFAQHTAGIITARQKLVSRTVTGNITIAAGDVSAVIVVNNSSITTQITVTIPTNASVSIPVGTWVEIVASNSGGAKILAAGGVTLVGPIYVMPNYATVRALKTATDTWMLMPIGMPSKPTNPKIRAVKSTVSTYNNAAYTNTPYDSIDATKTYNPDNEWFSLPGSGLTTGRRIIVNQAGEYEIMCCYAGTYAGATICRISKFTADNVSGDVLAMTAATQFFNLKWRGELAAGESVGVNHGVFGGTNDTDQVNASATPNDFRIVLVGK
jgi:hypothetical protein